MPGGFNVAVARFTVLDASGEQVANRAGQELSEWLSYAIEKETSQLPASLRANLRGPELVGVVVGADRDVRAGNAAQVAVRHNATILVYGVVTAGDGGYQVAPEFYVSDQSFGYGSEVAGPDRLGQPTLAVLLLHQRCAIIGTNKTAGGTKWKSNHVTVHIVDS
jgi:hypothetical protein